MLLSIPKNHQFVAVIAIDPCAIRFPQPKLRTKNEGTACFELSLCGIIPIERIGGGPPSRQDSVTRFRRVGNPSETAELW
jgi:hypothetical protein